MSFASDYITAYRLLRTGRVDRTLLEKLLYGRYDDHKEELRDHRRLTKDRVDVFGRVRAAIYAVKLAKEMRRQKALVNVVMNIEEDASDPTAVPTKHIHLFPVTVNRTVVQMRDPDKGPNA